MSNLTSQNNTVLEMVGEKNPFTFTQLPSGYNYSKGLIIKCSTLVNIKLRLSDSCKGSFVTNI